MVDDICVFCGQPVPEGRQVCPICEQTILKDNILNSLSNAIYCPVCPIKVLCDANRSAENFDKVCKQSWTDILSEIF